MSRKVKDDVTLSSIDQPEYVRQLSTKDGLNLNQTCFRLVTYSAASKNKIPSDGKELKILYGSQLDQNGNYCDIENPAFALAILKESVPDETNEGVHIQRLYSRNSILGIPGDYVTGQSKDIYVGFLNYTMTESEQEKYNGVSQTVELLCEEQFADACTVWIRKGLFCGLTPKGAGLPERCSSLANSVGK